MSLTLPPSLVSSWVPTITSSLNTWLAGARGLLLLENPVSLLPPARLAHLNNFFTGVLYIVLPGAAPVDLPGLLPALLV